ncbi:UV DNA damage repair endonuclease UvsE [Paenibacillus sp. GCM10023252]|uniref:UV DNA damage repair endonuclease UvsE n=1 Tax=Paenibacillus sp. GCM10023252 TaxID=3252649 RepID=UPI003612999E
MIVRFGFVAMSMQLENASPSRTMTYATFSKLGDREAAIRKLERIAGENLTSTLRVLKHCRGNDIHVYRFSSKLIPLATHEELADWDPMAALAHSFQELGRFVRDNGIRASFHPDHFCVFSTNRPEVLAKSELDLNYHVSMLEAMELNELTKCNIHIGGAYGDKGASAERFIQQFGALAPRYRNRITLENDDKTFTARETLGVAEASAVPMVLDIHHHAVNDGGDGEAVLHEELWPRVLNTWQQDADKLSGLTGVTVAEIQRQLPPKIHASSPKSDKDPRGHAEFLELEPLLRFLRGVVGSTPRLDCMLEAKSKDEALMRLMLELRGMEARGEGVRVIDGATIEIE